MDYKEQSRIIMESILQKMKDKIRNKEQYSDRAELHKEPKKGKILPGDKVRTDVKRISSDVKKIMNQPGIKEFVNNGLELITGESIFDSTDYKSNEYEADVDEFTLVRIDLWDYNGGNPRAIIDNSPNGWHPVNYAEEKLRGELTKLLSKKYPDYEVLEYGGDWDTGYISIGIK